MAKERILTVVVGPERHLKRRKRLGEKGEYTLCRRLQILERSRG
jgi:hypothetical protein